MRVKSGFTIVELVVVIIIIGILAALSLVIYRSVMEKTLDREAKAALASIRVAERNYRMEHNSYYPESATTTNNISVINSVLKLSLPDTARVNWLISLDTTGATPFGTAERNGSDARKWSINFSGTKEVACSGGSACAL